MVKTTWGGKTFYTCGSYKRYGASVCSKHSIWWRRWCWMI